MKINVRLRIRVMGSFYYISQYQHTKHLASAPDKKSHDQNAADNRKPRQKS